MSERKPAGVSWRTWIDRRIEEGQARGDFDDLPGAGRPLEGLERTRDELWWVREKLRREGVEYLPPSLAIRREAEQAQARAVAAGTEQEARRVIEEVNDRIRYLNSHMVDGPPTTLMPLDVEEVVADWRAAHVETESEPDPGADESDRPSSRKGRGRRAGGRRPWWIRRTR